mmetsp:Transcript_68522/g.108758  ORF Transcript_68522/g.108758 Transcript_68522/m.108758 type:complete len:210 (+) Transcript_68522:245-874(+)
MVQHGSHEQTQRAEYCVREELHTSSFVKNANVAECIGELRSHWILRQHAITLPSEAQENMRISKFDTKLERPLEGRNENCAPRGLQRFISSIARNHSIDWLSCDLPRRATSLRKLLRNSYQQRRLTVGLTLDFSCRQETAYDNLQILRDFVLDVQALSRCCGQWAWQRWWFRAKRRNKTHLPRNCLHCHCDLCQHDSADCAGHSGPRQL